MDSGPTLPCIPATIEGNAEGILRSRITSSADGPARTRERHRVRLCRPDSRARSAPSSTPFAALLSLPSHSTRMIPSSIRWTSVRYLWPLVYWISSAPRARTALQRKMLPAPRPTTSPNIPGPRKCGTLRRGCLPGTACSPGGQKQPRGVWSTGACHRPKKPLPPPQRHQYYRERKQEYLTSARGMVLAGWKLSSYISWRRRRGVLSARCWAEVWRTS